MWVGKEDGRRGCLQLNETFAGGTLFERLVPISCGIWRREGDSKRGEKEEKRGFHLVGPSSISPKSKICRIVHAKGEPFNSSDTSARNPRWWNIWPFL